MTTSRTGRGRLAVRAAAGVTVLGLASAAGLAQAAPTGRIVPGPTWQAWAAPAASPATPVGWPKVSAASRTRVVTLAPGVVSYHETYRTAVGPEQVSLVSVDLTRPGVRLGGVEAGDHLIHYADEKPSSMANRTGAIAGINGDYFDQGHSGAPLGGVVINGRLIKTQREYTDANVIVNRANQVVVSRLATSGTVTDTTGAHPGYPLSAVNDLTHLTGQSLVAVTREEGAAVRVPAGTRVIGTVQPGGRLLVRSVQDGQTIVPLVDAGGMILYAPAGAGSTWLDEVARPGVVLPVAEYATPSNVITSIEGSTVVVSHGAPYSDPSGLPPFGRNPETMIGISADLQHVLLVTIDGRKGESVGVTPAEAAQFLVSQHVTTGLLMDGGGSTTMVGRLPGHGTVSLLNEPSDPIGQRPVANGLFVYYHH